MENIRALEKAEALVAHHKDADIATCEHTNPHTEPPEECGGAHDGNACSDEDGAHVGAQAVSDDDVTARVSSVAERLHRRMEEAYSQLDEDKQ